MRHIRWHDFWFGDVGIAAILAGIFAASAGMYLVGRAEITLAFIGSGMQRSRRLGMRKVIRLELGK